ALEHGAVKHATGTEADLQQRFHDRLVVEFAHAVEADRRDGGTLLHRNDQHIAGGVDGDVAEQATGVQALNRLGRLFFGKGIAYPNGQIGEDGARVDPLYAIYLDVFDHEGCERIR